MLNTLNELLADQYRRHLGEIDNVVAIDFQGLNSEKMAEFRSKLREAKLSMEVVKNRIAIRALKDGGLRPMVEQDAANRKGPRLFRGQTAFLFGAEPEEADRAVDAAKFATSWLAENADSIIIKGGQMGPDVLDADGVRSIATLPSRTELLSTLAGDFLSVPQKVAASFQAGYTQVLYAFNALAVKKEGGPD